MTIVFDNQQLLPAEWRRTATGAALRMFNPGLLRDGAGWLLAYRVVSEPGLERRIAICRLDAEFRVIADTAVPVSDFIRFRPSDTLPAQATHWFADPRLYRFAGRPFLYWNSGWHEPQNCQFLVELDPATLRPIGVAHELKFSGRQKLEKNWGLFEHEHELYGVYSVSPHRILRFADPAAAHPVDFTEAFARIPNAGGFAQVHGGLRGGAPPQRMGDHFYSFCHSIENTANGYEYAPSAYRFAAHPPFAPTDMPAMPLPIAMPATARRTLPKLNPAIGDILYPAGAAYANGQWIISLGVDDERCALAVLEHATLLATLSPVAATR